MKFNIVVNYKLVATFDSFEEYTNHPLGAMDFYVNNSTTLCIDDNGSSCKPNAESLFPVKIFRLAQHSEN